MKEECNNLKSGSSLKLKRGKIKNRKNNNNVTWLREKPSSKK